MHNLDGAMFDLSEDLSEDTQIPASLVSALAQSDAFLTFRYTVQALAVYHKFCFKNLFPFRPLTAIEDVRTARQI